MDDEGVGSVDVSGTGVVPNRCPTGEVSSATTAATRMTWADRYRTGAAFVASAGEGGQSG